MAKNALTAPKARPVERTTIAASAFDQLISYVLNEDWKAGDRIPAERELSQQLGIARTSLREALKAMELVGMLDSRVGDGTFVCPRSEFLARPLLWAFAGTDQGELHDIIEARMLLETDVAGLAAERASGAEITQISEAIQTMRDNVAEGRPIMEADTLFHLSVAQAAHNGVLQNAVQLLRNLMRQTIYMRLRIPDVSTRVLAQHEAIYNAIRTRDTEGARIAMRKHLDDAATLIFQIIQHSAAKP